MPFLHSLVAGLSLQTAATPMASPWFNPPRMAGNGEHSENYMAKYSASPLQQRSPTRPVIPERSTIDFQNFLPDHRKCFESAYHVSSARKGYWRGDLPEKSLCQDNLSNMIGKSAQCIQRRAINNVRSHLLTAFNQLAGLCKGDKGFPEDFTREAEEFVEAANVDSFGDFYNQHSTLKPSNFRPSDTSEHMFHYDYIDTSGLIEPKWQTKQMQALYKEAFVSSPCGLRGTSVEMYECLANNDGGVLVDTARQVASQFYLEDPQGNQAKVLEKAYNELTKTVSRGLGTKKLPLRLTLDQFKDAGKMLKDLDFYRLYPDLYQGTSWDWNGDDGNSPTRLKPEGEDFWEKQSERVKQVQDKFEMEEISNLNPFASDLIGKPQIPTKPRVKWADENELLEFDEDEIIRPDKSTHTDPTDSDHTSSEDESDLEAEPGSGDPYGSGGGGPRIGDWGLSSLRLPDFPHIDMPNIDFNPGNLRFDLMFPPPSPPTLPTIPGITLPPLPWPGVGGTPGFGGGPGPSGSASGPGPSAEEVPQNPEAQSESDDAFEDAQEYPVDNPKSPSHPKPEIDPEFPKPGPSEGELSDSVPSEIAPSDVNPSDIEPSDIELSEVDPSDIEPPNDQVPKDPPPVENSVQDTPPSPDNLARPNLPDGLERPSLEEILPPKPPTGPPPGLSEWFKGITTRQWAAFGSVATAASLVGIGVGIALTRKKEEDDNHKNGNESPDKPQSKTINADQTIRMITEHPEEAMHALQAVYANDTETLHNVTAGVEYHAQKIAMRSERPSEFMNQEVGAVMNEIWGNPALLKLATSEAAVQRTGNLYSWQLGPYMWNATSHLADYIAGRSTSNDMMYRYLFAQNIVQSLGTAVADDPKIQFGGPEQALVETAKGLGIDVDNVGDIWRLAHSKYRDAYRRVKRDIAVKSKDPFVKKTMGAIVDLYRRGYASFLLEHAILADISKAVELVLAPNQTTQSYPDNGSYRTTVSDMAPPQSTPTEHRRLSTTVSHKAGSSSAVNYAVSSLSATSRQSQATSWPAIHNVTVVPQSTTSSGSISLPAMSQTLQSSLGSGIYSMNSTRPTATVDYTMSDVADIPDIPEATKIRTAYGTKSEATLVPQNLTHSSVFDSNDVRPKSTIHYTVFGTADIPGSMQTQTRTINSVMVQPTQPIQNMTWTGQIHRNGSHPKATLDDTMSGPSATIKAWSLNGTHTQPAVTISPETTQTRFRTTLQSIAKPHNPLDYTMVPVSTETIVHYAMSEIHKAAATSTKTDCTGWNRKSRACREARRATQGRE